MEIKKKLIKEITGQHYTLYAFKGRADEEITHYKSPVIKKKPMIEKLSNLGQRYFSKLFSYPRQAWNLAFLYLLCGGTAATEETKLLLMYSIFILLRSKKKKILFKRNEDYSCTLILAVLLCFVASSRISYPIILVKPLL